MSKINERVTKVKKDHQILLNMVKETLENSKNDSYNWKKVSKADFIRLI